MQAKAIKITSVILLSVFIIFALIMGIADYIVPSRQSYYKGQPLRSISLITIESDGAAQAIATDDHITTVNMTAKLFGVLPLKQVSVNYYDKMSFYVGGFPFGVKFFTNGIMVVDLTDVETENGNINPAYSAGIRANDVITKCNGQTVGSAEELTSMIEESGGKEVTLTYLRDGAEFMVSLVPVLSKNDGHYKTGMWIKDSGAGIGTVTFVSPEDNSFGGLGHGICDSQTGEVLPMESGHIMDVTLSGIEKGVVGDPGELKGFFSGKKLGAMMSNTECGVFGVYTEKPKEATRLCPIGLRSELKNGKASVVCTVDDGGAAEYEIEISSINSSAPTSSNKCFTVKITDPELIEKTGGIVQGMSGSPIIQNGKLVGAITHVCVNL
ncbi:MAG: SpoIVB peptidase [Ruminococcaceae bacterium]|nr:SpoIVB peptidase [Oscillospiraceae bacterium]